VSLGGGAAGHTADSCWCGCAWETAACWKPPWGRSWGLYACRPHQAPPAPNRTGVMGSFDLILPSKLSRDCWRAPAMPLQGSCSPNPPCCPAGACPPPPPPRSGLSTAVGGFIGVVTASNSASIKLFPVAELRRLAEEARMEVQAATAERAQVRLGRACAAGAAPHSGLHGVGCAWLLRWSERLLPVCSAAGCGPPSPPLIQPPTLSPPNPAQPYPTLPPSPSGPCSASPPPASRPSWRRSC
jgi:hypothetical protein